MASSHWYVGPWRWVATEDSAAYEGPEGTRVAIDFRGLPEQGQAGNDMSGLGLFYCPDAESVASDWEPLGQGSWHDIKANGRMRNLFPKRRGVKLDADDLIGLIRQTLMAGDPTGQEFCKPLLPTIDGTLEVTCGKRRHSERFRWGNKETNAIRDVIRNDMEDVIERAGKGKNKKQREHHRRVLDALCEKHGIEDWKEFVKPERVKDIPGRLKHETTYGDTFVGTDGTLLDAHTPTGANPGTSWTLINGTSGAIQSNAYRGSTVSNDHIYRLENNLSSDDQSIVTTVTRGASLIRWSGAGGRFSSATATGYFTRNAGAGNWDIIKIVSGARTTIATASGSWAAGVCEFRINGSTLESFTDTNISRVSATDTSISAGLRVAVQGRSSGADDVLDIYGTELTPTGGILYTQLERGIRGVTRGMYTDWRGFR